MQRFAVSRLFWVGLIVVSVQCSLLVTVSKAKTPQGKATAKGDATARAQPQVSKAPESPKGAPINSNTAEEYVQIANKALAAGAWPDAANAILGLIRDFGSHPEAEPVITRYQPALAVCLIRMERYEEALEPIQKALRSRNPASPALVQDLYFQKALCEFKIRQFAQARESLASFLSLSPTDRRYYEAHLQIAKCFLFENTPSAAANYLHQNRPHLDPPHLTEAVVLEFRALIEAEQPEKALDLYQSQQKQFSEAPDAISVNALLLQLGSGFLERSCFREAILCLGKVKPFESLVAFQQNRLKMFEKQLAQLDSLSDSKLRQSLILTSDKLTLELETFKDNTGYDAIVRIRLAAAYQALGRIREAALILEQAISTLPPDPYLEGVGVTLSQLWFTIECWDKAEQTFSLFKSKFPKSPALPALHYLKGIAQQKQTLNKEARGTFEAIQSEYPKTDWAVRSEFMTAFTELLLGESLGAAAKFQKFVDKHPSHEMVEEAESWTCIAFGIAKNHPLCLASAARYLKRHPQGPNRGSVLFQEARAFVGNRNYSKAIEVLRSFVAEYPEHPHRGEALLLLSEALEALDSYQDALDVCLALNTTNTSAFEKLWFNGVKLLQKLNLTAQIEDHLEQFAAIKPHSPQFADAVLLTQKLVPQTKDLGAPDTIIWTALRRYGDDPENQAVEPLLRSLVTQSGAEPVLNGVLVRLSEELESATARNLPIWSNRLRWALHLALKKDDAQRSTHLIEEAMQRADIEKTSALLISDFAEHCTRNHQSEHAETYWRDLLKWHPDSEKKDRAILALITASLERHNDEAARTLINRFEIECSLSPIAGSVGLQKAILQKQSLQTVEAKQTLESLLSNKQVRGDVKAEALLMLGNWHLEQRQPKLAIPYYQRVYVMHGRWKEQVAKAYIKSAEAFEILGDKTSARRTYEEMLTADIPEVFPEMSRAKERLICLGREE